MSVEALSILNKLKSDAASTAENQILSSIDTTLISQMDEYAKIDPTFSKMYKKFVSIIAPLSFEYTDGWIQARQEFFECETYFNFYPRIILNKIKESSSKSPDFKFIFNKSDYYLECKSLSWESPSSTLKETQEESFENKTRLEAASSSAPGVYSVSQSISPYDLSKDNYPYWLKPVCVLLDKLNNNLKKGQLNQENTILFVDLGILTFAEKPTDSIKPFVTSREKDRIWNGTLWTLCNGIENQIVFGAGNDFLRENNIARLRYNGVFQDFQNIKAVIFRCLWDKYMHNLVAIVRDKEYETKDILEFLNIKCNFSSNNTIY